MKRQLLFFIMLLLPFLANSQEIAKQKEIGVTFRSFDNFGFVFKTGKSNAMWRFNTILGSVTTDDIDQDSLNVNRNGLNIGLNAGREWRKPIQEKLELRYGFDLGYNYKISESDLNDVSTNNQDFSISQKSSGYGVNTVIGVNYLLGKSVVLGLEVLPAINYTKSIVKTNSINLTQKEERSGFNYGFSNTSATVSLLYRF